MNQTDIDHSKKVCVIGEETYKLLFDKGENAIGQDIRINGIYFSVVGIYKPNNNINIDGENAVFIPFTTFQKAFNSGDRMGWMAIAVEDNTPVPVVQKQIKDILKDRALHLPSPYRGVLFDHSIAYLIDIAFSLQHLPLPLLILGKNYL